jgi:hypothetical protein
MVLLLVGLRWRLGSLHGLWLARSALRTAAVSGVAAVAGWAAARLVTPDTISGLGAAAAASGSCVGPGVAAVAAFSVVFLTAAWGVRSPELEEILSAVRRRLGRS